MIILRVLCAVFFSATAAYAFARLQFPGKDFLFGIVLFQMMVPVQIFIIPQYLMVDKLNMRTGITNMVTYVIKVFLKVLLLISFFSTYITVPLPASFVPLINLNCV
jgi:multiple sugar transport system permease protein